MVAEDRFVDFAVDAVNVDADVVVQAHVLLNSFAVMAGRAATLRDHWDVLADDLRAGWLAELERTAVHAAAVMRSVALGLPPAALVDLEV